jgi:hypothetical protein
MQMKINDFNYSHEYDYFALAVCVVDAFEI